MVKRNNRKNGIVAFLLPLEFTAVLTVLYIHTSGEQTLQSKRVKKKRKSTKKLIMHFRVNFSGTRQAS